MTRLMALIGSCGLIAAAGCGSSDGGGGGTGGSPATDYSATIVRTTYGVPHITANNYGDLGFGQAYAYAQDNFCLLMREIVASNGQTARYFGEDEGDVADDFVYTLLNSDEVIEADGGVLIPGFIDLHIHGTHRYLVDHGPDDLAALCQLLPRYGVTGFMPTVCSRGADDATRSHQYFF